MDKELEELINDCVETEEKIIKDWSWYRRIPYRFFCHWVMKFEAIPEGLRTRIANRASIIFDPVWKKPKLRRIK